VDDARAVAALDQHAQRLLGGAAGAWHLGRATTGAPMPTRRRTGMALSTRATIRSASSTLRSRAAAGQRDDGPEAVVDQRAHRLGVGVLAVEADDAQDPLGVRELRAPWVATLFIGGFATILCLRSTLPSVVSSTAVMIITLYALIAISALISRVRQSDLPRPWKMPVWPLPPLIALVGVAIALSKQTERDLLIVLGIFVFGALYYGLYLHRTGRFALRDTQPERELVAASGDYQNVYGQR
jgi:hypothetical protein